MKLRRPLAAFSLMLLGCSDDAGSAAPASTPACSPPHYEVGDPAGHADPLGAKAANQARAGRLDDASVVPQPAHGRQRIQDGDFLLVNDKVAAVVEGMGLSDGYARFGGELLAIDRLGDDGKPLGASYYQETLMGVSNEMIDPTSITVLRDGSDGGEAIVRVTGMLRGIPFLDESLKAVFPGTFGLEAAVDYVLAPGSGKLLIRFGVINATPDLIDFGVEAPSQELHGFFHSNRSDLVTAEYGFGEPAKLLAWVGFDAGPSSFAWRSARGPLEYSLSISGFSLLWGPGFAAPACSRTLEDHAEVIPGAAGLDGLGEAIRAADGEPAWRVISGTVVDAAAAPVADAWVHELDADGRYLSRTKTDASGAFTVHAPAAPVTLVPQRLGYPTHAGTAVAASESSAALAFAAHATLHVLATDAATAEPLPVRVQVIPQSPVPATPPAFGVPEEIDGRLYQEFAVTGEAKLPVPPGEHRVIVSRGYEWEMLDTKVVAAAGETATVAAPLAHSVDTTGYMCADFHIHSFFSADSDDPVDHKVKGAIADGLDIPVSSELEWVIDFQPVIEQLGLTKWAFGVASEELTTFAWGHFGVVPLEPHEHEPNAGAIDWIGKTPAETFALVRARPEEPALIVNHPSGFGFGAYFASAGFDPKKGVGTNDLWSNDFDAVEVYNDSDFEHNREGSVEDWFSLLNHGRTVWAVGSSDSHHLRTSPVGYPRTCLWLGHDDPTKLTPNDVRDGVLSGASTISGGLFMTVTGPGGEGPGETMVVPGGKAVFTVTVEAPSWISAETLETIVDGETISIEPLLPLGNGPSKKFVNQVEVTRDPSKPRSWVVFHAKGDKDLSPLHPGRDPFAASNPVFLTGG